MTGRLVVQFLAGLTDPFIHFHMYNWMSNDFALSVFTTDILSAT